MKTYVIKKGLLLGFFLLLTNCSPKSASDSGKTLLNQAMATSDREQMTTEEEESFPTISSEVTVGGYAPERLAAEEEASLSSGVLEAQAGFLSSGSGNLTPGNASFALTSLSGLSSDGFALVSDGSCGDAQAEVRAVIDTAVQEAGDDSSSDPEMESVSFEDLEAIDENTIAAIQIAVFGVFDSDDSDSLSETEALTYMGCHQELSWSEEEQKSAFSDSLVDSETELSLDAFAELHIQVRNAIRIILNDHMGGMSEDERERVKSEETTRYTEVFETALDPNVDDSDSDSGFMMSPGGEGADDHFDHVLSESDQDDDGTLILSELVYLILNQGRRPQREESTSESDPNKIEDSNALVYGDDYCSRSRLEPICERFEELLTEEGLEDGVTSADELFKFNHVAREEQHNLHECRRITNSDHLRDEEKELSLKERFLNLFGAERSCDFTQEIERLEALPDSFDKFKEKALASLDTHAQDCEDRQEALSEGLTSVLEGFDDSSDDSISFEDEKVDQESCLMIMASLEEERRKQLEDWEFRDFDPEDDGLEAEKVQDFILDSLVSESRSGERPGGAFEFRQPNDRAFSLTRMPPRGGPRVRGDHPEGREEEREGPPPPRGNGGLDIHEMPRLPRPFPFAVHREVVVELLTDSETDYLNALLDMYAADSSLMTRKEAGLLRRALKKALHESRQGSAP